MICGRKLNSEGYNFVVEFILLYASVLSNNEKRWQEYKKTHNNI